MIYNKLHAENLYYKLLFGKYYNLLYWKSTIKYEKCFSKIKKRKKAINLGKK